MPDSMKDDNPFLKKEAPDFAAPWMPSLPPEVPRQYELDQCAPLFREAVNRTLADMRTYGWRARVYETLRSDQRQQYLHGFGRRYDDGRGVVTNAKTAVGSWHHYGLAADIVQDDDSPWNAPKGFWRDLGLCAERNGLKWGGRWKNVDLPHVQWGRCKKSPSEEAVKLLRQGGYPAVWAAVGALYVR